MKDVVKYKGAHIIEHPTAKYPNMVQIIKTSKKLNSLVGKKYVDLKHSMTMIDRIDTERLIEKSKIKSYKELENLGLKPLDQFL